MGIARLRLQAACQSLLGLDPRRSSACSAPQLPPAVVTAAVTRSSVATSAPALVAAPEGPAWPIPRRARTRADAGGDWHEECSSLRIAMRVTLHLTDRCNLRCTYCYADCATGGTSRAARDMSLDTARRAVDLALARSERRAHVVFFGGEPALRLALVDEVATYAREQSARQGKSATLEISTNGTLLSDRFFDVVRRHGMLVAVSIDGPKDVHDAHRLLAGGAGSFALVDQGLDRLLREIPWAIASSVVTPRTVARLSSSVDWVLDRGFRVAMTALDHSARWTEQDARVLGEELARLSKTYVRRTRRGKKFYLACLDGAIRSHVRGANEAHRACGAGTDHLSVSADGRLLPCVQFVGRRDPDVWCVGDVRDGLDPERARRILPRLAPSPPECEPCAIRDRCSSGCPCANLAATGQPDRVSPILCASQRHAVAAADRAANRLYQLRNKSFVHKHYNRFYPVALCVEQSLIEKEVRDASPVP
jgi:uncharacterized protein